MKDLTSQEILEAIDRAMKKVAARFVNGGHSEAAQRGSRSLTAKREPATSVHPKDRG
jgi:hypothetical protein